MLDLRSVATCAFRDKQGLLVAMPPQEDMSNKSFGTIFSYCFVLYTVSLPEKKALPFYTSLHSVALESGQLSISVNFPLVNLRIGMVD